MSKTRSQAQCCCEDNAKSNKQAVYQSYTTHIDDTIKHTGPFYAISALEDSEIDVDQCDTGIIEFDSGTKRTIQTDFTIPKGMTIYADILSIELNSGKILAYSKGVPGEAKEPTADGS
tara:strand:- start:45 stop:398 length:354 start_codon:yes stop_codon:yes gene_type:complete